jgi:hypothetical protein
LSAPPLLRAAGSSAGRRSFAAMDGRGKDLSGAGTARSARCVESSVAETARLTGEGGCWSPLLVMAFAASSVHRLRLEPRDAPAAAS